MQLRQILQAAIAATMAAGAFTPLAADDADITVVFESPSGNIFCYNTYETAVICLIFEKNWDEAQMYALLPDRHGECNLEQTAGFELRVTGPVRPYKFCHDGVFWPVEHKEKVVLPYGESIQNTDFSCLSEKSGMTCRNRSGHGFTMARAAYTIHSP